MSTATSLIEFRNITKSFGEVEAIADLNLSIEAGSIHAIVGENGAGKSTAMNILFGLYKPTAGEVLIRGKQTNFRSPIDAMYNGIGMVHQHFMLAELFSALDNLLLHSKDRPFFLDRKNQKKKLEVLAQSFGFDMPLDTHIENLPVGLQQRVEILKALSQESEILILDEPTAVLTPQEVEALFVNLKRLKALGKTIIIITHKLKEVMRITDKVTIFRRGRVVTERKTTETSTSELAELMVGYKLSEAPERTTTVCKKIVLSINELSAQFGTQNIQNLSLDIHASEIVGIAGVEGNGQNALIHALLDPTSLQKQSFSGKIILQGIETSKLSAAQIRDIGVGAFPEDRLRYGVLAQRPVYENFLLGAHRMKVNTNGPFLNLKNLFRDARKALDTYDIRPRNIHHIIGKLSGGNQQKLVVARELSHNPGFVLAAQPTRGVDIGAVDFIHSQLRKMRDGQSGVLLISSELDELFALSDRIFVLFKGKIVAEFARKDFDSFKIGAAMGGNLS